MFNPMTMTYNHSHTVRVAFFPYQNHPKTSRASKLNQNWFASPDRCSSPPGSSSETQKLGFYDGMTLAAKRFLFRNPDILQNCVCRLVALKACQAVSEKFPEIQNYEFNR